MCERTIYTRGARRYRACDCEGDDMRTFVEGLCCDHVWELYDQELDKDGRIILSRMRCAPVHGGCGATCTREREDGPIVEYDRDPLPPLR